VVLAIAIPILRVQVQVSVIMQYVPKTLPSESIGRMAGVLIKSYNEFEILLCGARSHLAPYAVQVVPIPVCSNVYIGHSLA